MHLCGRWPRKDFSTLVPPKVRDARILVVFFVMFSFRQIIFNFDSTHRFFLFSLPYRPHSGCLYEDRHRYAAAASIYHQASLPLAS